MTIGEQIQNLRIKKGLTQERLAEMLDVSRQSISKWELGQTIPDVEKIIRMSDLFDVSTDMLLLHNYEDKVNKNPLHLGSIYLIVKDFEKSVEFYEKFLNVNAGDRCRSGNKFIEFYFDNKCISLMNENNLIGHCTDLNSPYKFVQNYWVEDLLTEYERVKSLNIGKITEIRQAYPTYSYFHLTDPDNNIIEVTGGYHICQSCGMAMHESDYGRDSDESANTDYCKFCYFDGEFVKNETMEEMAESCIQFYVGNEFKTADEARNYLLKLYPALKRWKNNDN